MALTQLDARAALIVIDLQKGIVALPTVHPAPEIIRGAAALARAFRQHGLPVALVNVAGGAPGRTDAGPPKFTPAADWAELVPELDPQPGDIIITKHRWGAFLGTSLDQSLKQLGVTQLFMAGVATSIGVESTARSAFDLGYNVVFVVDAMTDRQPEAHQHSVDKLFPRMGQVTTTADVLALLGPATR